MIKNKYSPNRSVLNQIFCLPNVQLMIITKLFINHYFFVVNLCRSINVCSNLHQLLSVQYKNLKKVAYRIKMLILLTTKYTSPFYSLISKYLPVSGSSLLNIAVKTVVLKTSFFFLNIHLRSNSLIPHEINKVLRQQFHNSSTLEMHSVVMLVQPKVVE